MPRRSSIAFLSLSLAFIPVHNLALADVEAPGISGSYTSDISKSWRQENSFRSKTCLNGVWKLALSEKVAQEAPAEASDYGFVSVPSSWMHPCDFPVCGSPHYSAGKHNAACKWKDKPFKSYICGWYQREFVLPPDLAGKRIFLRFDRVTLRADIYLNGKELGAMTEREEGRWEVSSLLKTDGSPNLLQVRVSACLNEEIKVYLAGDRTTQKRLEASLRGITGDVWLETEPEGATVSDVFIIPSFRKKEISFDVELEQHRERLQVVAEIYEKGAKDPFLKFESGTVAPRGEAQRMTFGGPWKNPVLWDMDSPYLYEVRISLFEGERKIDESLPITFGFREAWIEGRDVILNGKPLHLFSFTVGGYESLVNTSYNNAIKKINLFRRMGFNSVQIASEGIYEKGTAAEYYEDVFKICDQGGMPVALPLVPVYAQKWDMPDERENWNRSVASIIRKYRNHPSLLFYSMNFNYVGYPWDLSPHTWGADYAAPGSISNFAQKRRDAGESESFVRSIDPNRIVYHHESGNFRSMITANLYINWPPLQEYEEYPSLWSENGRKPLLFVELGLVCSLDFYRARAGNFEQVRDSEILEAEYISEFIGPEAFKKQEDRYLDIIASNPTSEKSIGVDKYNIRGPYCWDYALSSHDPIASYSKIAVPMVMRGWRTYGFTGFSPNGMDCFGAGRRFVPWRDGVAGVYGYDDLTAPGAKPACYWVPDECDKPSDVALDCSSVLKPVLLYVGGDRKGGFAAKDHAYFSGDKVEKQAVLVNDLRHDLPLDVRWELVRDSNGVVAAGGQLSMEAKAGGSLMKEFEFEAPLVDAKESFTLRLDAPKLSKEQAHIWDFRLQVFPRGNTRFDRICVALYDPVGETEGLLRKMGVRVVPIGENLDWASCDFAVIGRGALSSGGMLPPQELFVAVKRGMTLLCFEQKDLSLLGLRVHPRGVRNAYPLMKDHQVLAGLDREDLCDWRGAFTSIDPYEQPSIAEDMYPEEAWRWGANGTVCSCMIEKPHVGAAQSLLECGFDLNFTPLLEAREGLGRLIVCQLELTGRYGLDPAASKIFESLIKYASDSKALPPLRSVASCAEKDGSLMATIGGKNSEAGIILCDDFKEADKAGWPDFVKNGGTVIMVGQEFLKDLSWLPVPLKTRQATYYRAIPNIDAELIRGASVSDLFLKDKRQDWVVSPSEGVTLLAEPGMIADVPWGKGYFILFGINPLSYKDSKVSPERMARIYCKLSRVLSCIVSNLHGDFHALSDKHFNGGSSPDLPLPSVWRFSIDPGNIGYRQKWMAPDFDDSAWRDLKAPGLWEGQGVTDANPEFPKAAWPYDGYAWYRCKIKIPKGYQGKEPYLMLGKVDDMDSTYFNGVRIGQVDSDFKGYYSVVRDYKIPEGLIKFDEENTIAVKVYDNFQGGGIFGPHLYIHAGTKGGSYPYLDQRPAFNPYHLTRW